MVFFVKKKITIAAHCGPIPFEAMFFPPPPLGLRTRLTLLELLLLSRRCNSHVTHKLNKICFYNNIYFFPTWLGEGGAGLCLLLLLLLFDAPLLVEAGDEFWWMLFASEDRLPDIVGREK